MMIPIKIEAFLTYLDEENEEIAEVLAKLTQRKLCEQKYRKKLEDIIQEAQKEIVDNLPR